MPRRARDRAGAEGGFTLIEVLVAGIVLVVGLLGLFETLDVAGHTTMVNRQRQAETSLAREIIEDARSLAYAQLTQTALAGSLQPMVSGSTLSGQGLDVARSITGGAAVYNFTVSLGVTALTTPGDEKSLTVTVAPRAGTEPTVHQSTVIYSRPAAGPAVTCLTTQQTAGQPACPGTNVSYTTTGTSSVTFHLTTTIQADAIQWLVNGNPPPSSQIGPGSTDPFRPGATTVQFTWMLPTSSAGSIIDGRYTISAYAQDSSGDSGAPSSLQVTINEHPPLAPTAPTGSATVTAGYNPMICATGGGSCPVAGAGGVDVQWLPSPDQDVNYYDVIRQVSTTSTVVCSHVTGTSCTDLNPTSPGTLPSQCSDPPTDDTNQPAIYSVVPYDTSGGAARAGSSYGSADADVCDHPPAAPANLTAAATNGALTLTWAPAVPADLDPGDSIIGWRIYRWAGGSTMSDPGSRLAYIGTLNGTQAVTSFIDSSPDPNGASQTYCVTAVDSHLNESQCSNVVTG